MSSPLNLLDPFNLKQQVARLPPAGPAPGPPAPDMRTALRLGAGGTGLQGRGGIEGEPIRLDSEDPRDHH